MKTRFKWFEFLQSWYHISMNKKCKLLIKKHPSFFGAHFDSLWEFSIRNFFQGGLHGGRDPNRPKILISDLQRLGEQFHRSKSQQRLLRGVGTPPFGKTNMKIWRYMDLQEKTPKIYDSMIIWIMNPIQDVRHWTFVVCCLAAMLSYLGTLVSHESLRKK